MTYSCCCCGHRFADARPHNPGRDHGYGTCQQCREWISARNPDDAERASNLDERYA